MKTLLENGANVDAQGGEYGNALQAAANSGCIQLFQVLLEEGANVIAQGGRYGNALIAASMYGHVKVVHILVDEGADIDAQGGRYGNAQQVALIKGQDQVVRTLLDAGADINPPGGLQGALRYKHREQMLLERGANKYSSGEVMPCMRFTQTPPPGDVILQDTKNIWIPRYYQRSKADLKFRRIRSK